MNKLKVDYVDINELAQYENNAKIHTEDQIERIAKSINRFGMNDPIGIKENTIVEGHGRYLACMSLGIKKVPVVRLDHLDEEQQIAYMNIHNKLTMSTGYDLEVLEKALENIDDVDMSEYGFETLEDMLTGLDAFFEDENANTEKPEKTNVQFTIEVNENNREQIENFLEEQEIYYEVK